MNDRPTNLLAFDAAEIQRMLPHKYPFLLLDSAFNIIPGKSGNGVKHYTLNEWFFQGHFPGEPIVPGVLIVESLAQLTAVVYLAAALESCGGANGTAADLSSLAGRVGYLVKVNVKFISPMKPGNTLEMAVSVVRKMGNLSLVNVKASAGRATVVTGELSVSERDGF
ncbi:MAG: 3-hydroxyacyl-ACP dehydratase FabZ [Spirochaetales bacterium]|nr:3-hydroxyacyl-ACP dehydratase FabZ [Spirochaetales bacterium]